LSIASIVTASGFSSVQLTNGCNEEGKPAQYGKYCDHDCRKENTLIHAEKMRIKEDATELKRDMENLKAEQIIERLDDGITPCASSDRYRCNQWSSKFLYGLQEDVG